MSYDEFAMLPDNAAEVGLAWTQTPTVQRRSHEPPSGNQLSYLKWGEDNPRVVFLHGGAQNAHTWDTVLLALDLPALAIDLPGHGHSAWRPDKDYHPTQTAVDLTHLIRSHVDTVDLLVGMSLGGLTATVIAAENPDLVSRLALVDITPGVNRDKATEIINFIAGPEEFDTFDEILQRTIEFNPTRSESSLRRGVLHNAHQREDGKWVWRYDLPLGERADDIDHRFADLWNAIESVESRLLLLQGDRSPVVDDDDVAEFKRRQPLARHELVADAGHSIQGDQPLVLAQLLKDLLAEQ